MFKMGSLNSAFSTSPAHHGSPRRNTALQNLIPSNHFFLFAGNDFSYTFVKITLQLLSIFDVILFHKGLNTWITLPISFVTFVTSHMNIFVWKEHRYFCK